MNTSEINALHILHVGGVIGMIGATFFACAGAADTKKKVMMWGGIASVIVLLTGIRLWQGQFGFAGAWPVVKGLCWLAIAGLSGMAYRKRNKAALVMLVTLAAAFVALVMVYLKPF